MTTIIEGLLATPDRLNEVWTRILLVVSPLVLALAVLGVFLYDGGTRLAYVLAIGSIGLGNLLWAIGSVLPEERGGRFLRNLTRPLFVVMVISLPVAVLVVTV